MNGLWRGEQFWGKRRNSICSSTTPNSLQSSWMRWMSKDESGEICLTWKIDGFLYLENGWNRLVILLEWIKTSERVIGTEEIIIIVVVISHEIS